jgi:hypothetical protein
MSYHQDPVVNDLVLTIINDGDGSQCGRSYQQRCNAAENGIFEFRYACREYGRQRSRSGSSRPTREQVLIAADILQSYYRERVKEIA